MHAAGAAEDLRRADMIREGVPLAPPSFTLPPVTGAGCREGSVSEALIANQILLAVFPPGEDRTSLDNILDHSGWQLQFACTLEETQTALRAFPFTVILSEGRLSDGHCWKDILHTLHNMSNPPALIVADRLADEALWVEVLNLGGYDVLTKLFNAREVLHAMTTACHFSADQRQRAATLRKPPKSAGSESMSGLRKRAASGGL